MKKLLPLLLCLLLCGCAATYDGPTEGKYVLSEYEVRHSVFGIESTDRYVYSYDIYGNRVREMEYNDEGLEYVTKLRYDENGNEISRVEWDHTGLIPLPDSRREATYDDQGRILTSIYFDGWGRETSRSTYTYDDENLTYTWQNDSGDHQLYYLDAEGRELRVVGSSGYETVYEYDDRGNRTGWTSYHEGIRCERYEARYDEQDRQVWGGRYDETGTLESETEYIYDDEAHTKTTRRPDDRTRIEYYAADGRLILIEDYDETGEITMIQQYYYREILVPATGGEEP